MILGRELQLNYFVDKYVKLEIFENEFDPIDEEATPKDDDDGNRKNDENVDDDDDDKEYPSVFMTTYLPMAIGVVGVAVLVGMWLSGQRSGPHNPHVQ